MVCYTGTIHVSQWCSFGKFWIKSFGWKNNYVMSGSMKNEPVVDALAMCCTTRFKSLSHEVVLVMVSSLAPKFCGPNFRKFRD